MAEQPELTAREALADVSDVIRFTFRYREEDYCEGMRGDVARIKDEGFELVRLKNYWSGDQYKGINSQWIDRGSCQRFEVQFHTGISFQAKQLTHDAYERLRTMQADKFEQMVLGAFQAKVSAEVPVPPGATDIPDYP
jgi:hypothetical protein